MKRLVTIVLLLGGLFVAGCSAEASETAASSSSEATLDFTGTTVDGASFEGTSLAGKPTVLWFWAPWCPTCRAQAAGVSDIATTYGEDVNVVGVGSLDESSAIDEFAAAVPADFTQLDDPDGEVWRHFGITAQSTYVVLDADRAIIASGYLTDEELASTVADVVG